MLSLAHTIISLPFGVYLENPVTIFVAAFVFHLFADTLLHWNVYPDQAKKWFYPLAALDVIGGVVVAWIIMGNSFTTWPILLAIFAGNLPDIMQGLWDLAGSRMQRSLRVLRPVFDFHDKLQLETKGPIRGLIWQVILIGITLVII